MTNVVIARRPQVSSWCTTLSHCKQPASRLFCFPYAGSGPSVFKKWAGLLPTNVEVIGITYPGREARADEALLNSIEDLVDRLVPKITFLLDRPCVFFGYSMGALVSFELACKLSEFHGIAPQHLFISAAGAPHIPEPNPIHHLDNIAFFKALIKLNGMPREVLSSKEMIRYALPILRADFTACENYQRDLGSLVRFPMTVLGGDQDGRVDKRRLEAWRHFAGVAFKLSMFDGNHFFLRTHGDQIIASVRKVLSGIES